MVKEAGASFGYVQSDEISLVLKKGDLIFGGRGQKLESSLAAICSVFFTKNLPHYIHERADDMATFDCRAWNVPTPWEAANTIRWRFLDAIKNSVSMCAFAQFSHKSLLNKNTVEKLELLRDNGTPWEAQPYINRQGSMYKYVEVSRPFSTEEIARLPPKHEAYKNPGLVVVRHEIQLLPELSIADITPDLVYP
jgi:tRNA(His) guanylyltransferase